MKARSLLALLAALFLTTVVTEKSEAMPRSFAVFVAYYNTKGGVVRGGVAGTAFFVNPTTALTAYHVLQAKSFVPVQGFSKVRVWLVHENYRPIELKLDQIHTRRLRDMTEIRVNRPVDSRFVFHIGRPTVNAQVETPGILANSVGPVLAWQGDDLQIVKVPHLERRQLSGKILETAKVTLQAKDVNLDAAPCVKLSYQPIVGFSGGPVLSNGRVVAMNSFAEPGTRLRTWALNLGASSLP